MSYTFTNKPFLWTNHAGISPTAEEIALGLQGGMALPAMYVNQQWTQTYNAVNEIQEIIEDGTLFTNIDNLSVIDSLSVGRWNVISGKQNAAIGVGNIVMALNTVVGKYSKAPTAATESGTDGDVFVVGNGTNGTGSTARSNAFRVTAEGQCMGTTFFASSGADYAELFEWIDGNSDNEDRRGLFVTLDGEKIRLATADDDYILGAISGAPTVIGDAATEDWHGKYERDVFGAKILENGSYKLSETFDQELDNNYTSRLKRAEWGIVGLTGKLILVDDGTCQVNGYCYPSKDGIATASEKGYRVMSRIDDTHIRVLIK